MKSILKSAYCLFVLIGLLASSATAKSFQPTDTGMITVVRALVKKHRQQLHYPLAVMRFYEKSQYKLAWVAPDTVKTHATDAMLLLDCILQYGLNHADYHPDRLLYNELSLITSHTSAVSKERKALFDIWLTDAILAFENNLHYGKANPGYPAVKIDANSGDGFDAVANLGHALKSKEFTKAITMAQPQSLMYRGLQRQLYLQTGLFTGDCYEFPLSGIAIMAINMERLRWYSSRKKALMEINIPSLTLTAHLQTGDRYYKLKASKAALNALAGQLNNPAPMFMSVVNGQVALQVVPVGSSIIASEVNTKLLVKDAARQSLTLYVLKSKELATRLSAQNSKKSNPVPAAFTYITCVLKGAELIKYKDIYGLDKGLQAAMYPPEIKKR